MLDLEKKNGAHFRFTFSSIVAETTRKIEKTNHLVFELTEPWSLDFSC